MMGIEGKGDEVAEVRFCVVSCSHFVLPMSVVVNILLVSMSFLKDILRLMLVK
jgi:hypothetical protein